MLKKILPLFTLLLFCIAITSCKKVTPEEYNAKASNPELFHECTDQLTDVIVFDIFKPPVASRIYAYSYLAAYEAMAPGYKEYQSFSGRLNDFDSIPQPEQGKEYCFPLAAVKAFITVGSTVTFSKDRWDKFEAGFYKKYEGMGIPEEVYQSSIEFGEKIGKHVLAHADKDRYKQTRGFRHTLKHEPGSWEPTPPTYAEACEPQWNKIRSFTLDSSDQFPAPTPAPYDLNEKSKFYQLTKEVYDIGKNMTEEQKAIAYFWDDNPFVTNISGHVTFAEKKMTPPGHWIAITKTINKQQKADMMKSIETYALTSLALFDGFIACWNEKYKSIRVRPVTVINKTFDQNWLPFLETPAFPEYTSGHSAISAAAGRILTHLYGNVQFTDSTEYKYGHGVRSFKSFEDAYWETSMSRVYGGIHYRDGVEEGTRQGEKVGEWIWAKLKAQPGEEKIDLAKSSMGSKSEEVKSDKVKSENKEIKK